MKYSVEIQSDLQEIMDWYANQRDGLDREIIGTVKSAIAFVYRPQYKKIRFKHLDRFPYIIVFKIIRDKIIVY